MAAERFGLQRVKSRLDDQTERIASEVIGVAIDVHRTLGPGFPEKVYENALCIGLTKRSIPFIRQHVVRVQYEGQDVGEGRVDLLVADRLIVENKAVDALNSVYEAQLASYLKATNLHLGLLINYNCTLVKDGIRRIIR